MAANWNLVGRNTIFKGSIFRSAMFAYLSDIPIISHPTSCLSGQGKNSFRGEVVDSGGGFSMKIIILTTCSTTVFFQKTTVLTTCSPWPEITSTPSVRPPGVPFPKLPPPIVPNVESLTASWQKDTHSDPGSGIECGELPLFMVEIWGGRKSTFGLRIHPQYVSICIYTFSLMHMYIYIWN